MKSSNWNTWQSVRKDFLGRSISCAPGGGGCCQSWGIWGWFWSPEEKFPLQCPPGKAPWLWVSSALWPQIILLHPYFLLHSELQNGDPIQFQEPQTAGEGWSQGCLKPEILAGQAKPGAEILGGLNVCWEDGWRHDTDQVRLDGESGLPWYFPRQSASSSTGKAQHRQPLRSLQDLECTGESTQ